MSLDFESAKYKPRSDTLPSPVESMPYSDSDGFPGPHLHPIAGEHFDNHQLYGSIRKGGAVSFFSWQCAGLAAATFSSVFSYTALRSVTSPLMKTQLNLTKPEQLAVQRLVELPMALSFLIGLLSDCYPIFGLRRKAYMLVGLVMNAVGTVLIGVLAAHFESLKETAPRNGTLVVVMILLTAVASFGCMFTYLCVHTRSIELSQQEPLGTRGVFQANYSIVRRLTSLFTGVFTYIVLGKNPDHPSISLSTTLFIMTALCVAPLPAIIRWWREEHYSLPVPFKARASIFWKIMQQKAVWRTLTFICVVSLFLAIKFTDSAGVIRAWAGAANDNTLVTRVISDLTQLLVIFVWRLLFMNRPWRTFFGLAPIFQILPALVISGLVAYDSTRNRYLYRTVISFTLVSDGIVVLTHLVPLTEVVQEGSEGVTVGLVLSLQRLISVFSTTNSQGLFSGTNFYKLADVAHDTHHAHKTVFFSLVLNYAINALAVLGLLALPAQKLDAQQMRMYGGFTKIASSLVVLFATVLFVYSMVINIMSVAPGTSCLPIVGGLGCR